MILELLFLNGLSKHWQPGRELKSFWTRQPGLAAWMPSAFPEQQLHGPGIPGDSLLQKRGTDQVISAAFITVTFQLSIRTLDCIQRTKVIIYLVNAFKHIQSLF